MSEISTANNDLQILSENRYQLTNNNLSFIFDKTGVEINRKHRGKAKLTLKNIKLDGANDFVREVNPYLHGDELNYQHHNGIIEWYRQRGNTLEHGFTITKSSKIKNSIEIIYAVGGDVQLFKKNNAIAVLNNKKKQVVEYGKLYVYDANKKLLESELLVEDKKIVIKANLSNSKFPVTIDPIFSEETIVTATEPELTGTTGNYGMAVSVQADTLVVGAPQSRRDVDGNGSLEPTVGSVYVYRKINDVWVNEKHRLASGGVSDFLMASDGAGRNNFGFSVDVDGNFIVVSARSKNLSTGGAYVFQRINNEWHEIQIIDPPVFSEARYFGQSVAISGTTMVIGAYESGVVSGGVKTNTVGKAFVYEWDGSIWSYDETLIADDWAGGDRFGSAVDISGDTIVVGAMHDNWDADASEVGEESDVGSAYVYTRNGARWDEQKLVFSDAIQNDQIGRSIAVDGDNIMVGSYFNSLDRNGNGTIEISESNLGAVYAFEKAGDQWVEIQKILSDDTSYGDHFGSKLGIQGRFAVMASQDHKVDVDGDIYTEVGVGAVYVSHKDDDGVWRIKKKIIADNPHDRAYFGSAVGIDGDYIAVGSKKGYLGKL